MFGRVIMSQIQKSPTKEGPWMPINCPNRKGNCAMGCKEIRLTASSIRLCMKVLPGAVLERISPPTYEGNR